MTRRWKGRKVMQEGRQERFKAKERYIEKVEGKGDKAGR